jgi:hypothetical protein
MRRAALPKALLVKPQQATGGGKSNNKKRLLSCPSSEALVFSVLFVFAAVILMAITRTVLSHHPPLTVLTSKTMLTGAVLLGQNALLGGDLIGPLVWEDALWWQAVAALHMLAKLTLLVGLQSVSFAVVCGFACLAALGYGFAPKTADGGSPESVVLGAGVVGGIVVLALQDAGRFSGLVYAALVTWAVASWAYLYLVKLSSPAALTKNLPERCSATATTDFYVSCGSLPLLVGMYWWMGGDATGASKALSAAATAAGMAMGWEAPEGPVIVSGSSWVGSFFVPFADMSVADKVLLVGAVFLEQVKTRLGARILAKSSLRFFVGTELFSDVIILVLGGAGTRASPSYEGATVVALIAVLGTTLFAVVFIPREPHAPKKALKLGASAAAVAAAAASSSSSHETGGCTPPQN